MNRSTSAAHPAPLTFRSHSVSAPAAFMLVLGLTAMFAAMRAGGMLGPPSLRWLLPLSFCLMIIAPWILLRPEGRLHIGLVKPRSPKLLVHGAAAGALAALLCFGAGLALFGHGQDNWFVSIANHYRGLLNTTGMTVVQLHLVFTLPALLFSPIGEEIFFRGLLQGSLEQRFTERTSTMLECAAFGLIHLLHHGLIRGATGLVVLPLSGAIWVTLMFLVALLFAHLRKRSGSLYPSMIAHAAFNLTMNVAIFSALW